MLNIKKRMAHNIRLRIKNVSLLNYPVDDFLIVSTILLYIIYPLNGGISGILVLKDFTKLLLHAL